MMMDVESMQERNLVNYKISVIIPVYNGERFLNNAIESVLRQNHEPFEILVVNDGSTDGTGKVLQKYTNQIRIINQDNRGVSSARNKAMRIARGDYIAFLDADDQFLENHLGQLNQGASQGQYDIVYDCLGPPYCAIGKKAPRKPDGKKAFLHLKKYQLWVQTAMVNRAFLERTKITFPEELSHGEDAVFFWRLLLAGAKVKYVRDIGCIYGIHDSNATKQLVALSRKHFELFEREIMDMEISAGHPRTLATKNCMLSKIKKSLKCAMLHEEVMSFLTDCYLNNSYHKNKKNTHVKLIFAKNIQMSDRVRLICFLFWKNFRCLKKPYFERRLFGFLAYARMQNKGIKEELC